MFALCALAALGLGACGDDSSNETSTVAQTTTTTVAAGAGEGSANRASVIESAGGPFDSQAIYSKAAPGVVTVISVLGGGGATDLFGGGGGGEGQGSGFVISDTGAQTGPLHPAKEVYVQFADHNQVEARIVGFDPFADVALLRVDPDGLDLQPLPLGSENDVAVGEGVAAIGSPFGQEQSLSVGVVSATDRTIDSLTQFQIDGAIQTDASINPGNSGGPLLDAAGEVVGINQQIRTASGGNEGVGFAVPIDLAERAADQLRDDGEVSYAYLGVSTQPLYPQLADELGLDVDTGAIVSSIEPNSPAADAGLQAGDEPIRFQGAQYKAGGDVIVAVDGHEIQANADLPRLISLLDPGDEISLDIIRDGDRQQVEVTLGDRPDDIGP